MKKLGKIATLGALIVALSSCDSTPINKVPVGGSFYLVDENKDRKVDFVYHNRPIVSPIENFSRGVRGPIYGIDWISPNYIPKEYEFRITPETKIMTSEIQELADSILSLQQRFIAKTDSVFTTSKIKKK